MTPSKYLVAYTTNAGSTADAAQIIASQLGQNGREVEVRRLEEVTDLTPYAAVVIGAPMMVGWHRAALRFVKQQAEALRQRPCAYFFTAMNLTQTEQTQLDGIPLWVDPVAAKPPHQPGRLSFKERYALPVNYLQPALKAAPQVKPASVGFFGGKMALYNLKWWQAAFVLLVIQARPGGSHNEDYLQQWAADLRSRWASLA